MKKKIMISIICILLIIEAILLAFIYGKVKNVDICDRINSKINKNYDIVENKLIVYPLLEQNFDNTKIEKENLKENDNIKKLDKILEYSNEDNVSYTNVLFNERSFTEIQKENSKMAKYGLEVPKDEFDYSAVVGTKKEYISGKKKLKVYSIDKKYKKKLKMINYYTSGEIKSSNIHSRFKNISDLKIYKFGKKYFVSAEVKDNIYYIVAERMNKSKVLSIISNIDREG